MAEKQAPTPSRKQAGEPGKVLKVIGVDSSGEKTAEWSHQLPVDPFDKQYQAAGLMEPPYSLEQLVFLAEQHPTHSAALDQKAVDVVGTGWEWRSDDDESSQDTGQRDELEAWFKSLADDEDTDETTHEILLAAWNDVETLGQGFIELAFDSSGKLRHWFHVPGHTCRFHRDGKRIAQIRQGKRVWFKRWIPGDKTQVDRVTGAIGSNVKSPANQIFVLKRPSRRSSWYGVPIYMSATGWITLSTAARDDNLLFFENRREPRWAIILENVEDDPEIENMLRQALQVDLKQPHRNLLIPLAGPAKVNFQKLGDNKGDMSWERLQDRADVSILLAHRMPGERIGLVRVGNLGGTAVSQSVQVYKESFVQTAQALLAARVNKLIAAESGISDAKWLWHPAELDLTEDGAEEDRAIRGFGGMVLRMNEARERMGEEPLPEDDDRGSKFFFELAPGAAAAAAGAAAGGAPIDQAQLEQQQIALADRIRGILSDGTGETPDPPDAEE